MKNISEVKLVTDGGCRGNPGIGAIGFILFNLDDQVIAKGGKLIGQTTNNRAEYLALIEGLEQTSKYTDGIVHCFSDSELVIKQVTEAWKINDDELKQLFYQVLGKESLFNKVNYTHLKRTHHAIELVDEIVSQTLNEKKVDLICTVLKIKSGATRVWIRLSPPAPCFLCDFLV